MKNILTNLEIQTLVIKEIRRLISEEILAFHHITTIEVNPKENILAIINLHTTNQLVIQTVDNLVVTYFESEDDSYIV